MALSVCEKGFLEEDATRIHASSVHDERMNRGEIESEQIWSEDEVPEVPEAHKYRRGLY